ncbi:MAG: condensation domain-containing protein, partial [Acidobacteriota bacterium]
MARTSEDPPANDRAERLRDAIRKKKAARDASRPGSERAAQEPRIPPRPERVPARLGPMQRSLWLAHRLDPTSAADHLVDAYRLSGQVDSARLRSAFRQVVRRHRLLRSSFRSTGTGVVQDILPAEAVEATFDLEVVPAPQDDPMVVAAREAQRPFDLSTPPLVRMVLVQQLDRPVILMLVLHHLLADEQALGVFWREMSGALRDDLDEAAPAGQYDDVVHWLGRREPDGQELDAWRRRLDPAPPELALPFQAMPAAERRGRPGRLVARPLPADLAAGVRELAQRAGATPFFVLAFAYGLFLRRLTEGPPPAFASPVSTRLRAGTADMIGYFTNPVVMPTLVDESMDVASALRAFRSEALERMAQATIPFQDLVEALDPPRSAGRHPIFQTMFVLRRPGAMPELGPDIAVERLQLDLGVAKFDLTLFVTEGDRPELELAAEYRIGRFDDEGVRRLLALYETLLCHLVAADLETPVRDVSMLDADEAGRLQTLSQGHQLTRALDRLPQRTAAVAATSPDAPALVFEGRATTYAELDEMAN